MTLYLNPRPSVSSTAAHSTSVILSPVLSARRKSTGAPSPASSLRRVLCSPSLEPPLALTIPRPRTRTPLPTIHAPAFTPSPRTVVDGGDGGDEDALVDPLLHHHFYADPHTLVDDHSDNDDRDGPTWAFIQRRPSSRSPPRMPQTLGKRKRTAYDAQRLTPTLDNSLYARAPRSETGSIISAPVSDPGFTPGGNSSTSSIGSFALDDHPHLQHHPPLPPQIRHPAVLPSSLGPEYFIPGTAHSSALSTLFSSPYQDSLHLHVAAVAPSTVNHGAAPTPTEHHHHPQQQHHHHEAQHGLPEEPLYYPPPPPPPSQHHDDSVYSPYHPGTTPVNTTAATAPSAFTPTVFVNHTTTSAEPHFTGSVSLRPPSPHRRKCLECGHVSKCASDFKKHMTKHTKPFMCDVDGCTRGEGFTTINDLERHKKSKHRIATGRVTDRSYKCAAPDCRSRNKIWPRRDNFRQHITRIHPDADAEDLLRRSEELGRQAVVSAGSYATDTGSGSSRGPPSASTVTATSPFTTFAAASGRLSQHPPSPYEYSPRIAQQGQQQPPHSASPYPYSPRPDTWEGSATGLGLRQPSLHSVPSHHPSQASTPVLPQQHYAQPPAAPPPPPQLVTLPSMPVLPTQAAFDWHPQDNTFAWPQQHGQDPSTAGAVAAHEPWSAPPAPGGGDRPAWRPYDTGAGMLHSRGADTGRHGSQ